MPDLYKYALEAGAEAEANRDRHGAPVAAALNGFNCDHDHRGSPDILEHYMAQPSTLLPQGLAQPA